VESSVAAIRQGLSAYRSAVQGWARPRGLKRSNLVKACVVARLGLDSVHSKRLCDNCQSSRFFWVRIASYKLQPRPSGPCGDECGYNLALTSASDDKLVVADVAGIAPLSSDRVDKCVNGKAAHKVRSPRVTCTTSSPTTGPGALRRRNGHIVRGCCQLLDRWYP
jgi:hypothetical protein